MTVVAIVVLVVGLVLVFAASRLIVDDGLDIQGAASAQEFGDAARFVGVDGVAKSLRSDMFLFVPGYTLALLGAFAIVWTSDGAPTAAVVIAIIGSVATLATALVDQVENRLILQGLAGVGDDEAENPADALVARAARATDAKWLCAGAAALSLVVAYVLWPIL